MLRTAAPASNAGADMYPSTAADPDTAFAAGCVSNGEDM